MPLPHDDSYEPTPAQFRDAWRAKPAGWFDDSEDRWESTREPDAFQRHTPDDEADDHRRGH